MQGMQRQAVAAGSPASCFKEKGLATECTEIRHGVHGGCDLFGSVVSASELRVLCGKKSGRRCSRGSCAGHATARRQEGTARMFRWWGHGGMNAVRPGMGWDKAMLRDRRAKITAPSTSRSHDYGHVCATGQPPTARSNSPASPPGDHDAQRANKKPRREAGVSKNARGDSRRRSRLLRRRRHRHRRGGRRRGRGFEVEQLDIEQQRRARRNARAAFVAVREL